MGLRFIIGGSGTGKSCYAYDEIIREALEHPDVFYYILVPEQFTLKTQKTVVERTPGKGILNIDVLSFQRLAYRVLDETGGDDRSLLEDIGKSMVLRKVAQAHQKELQFLGNQMKKPGFLDEMKSLISEFMQYEIGEEELLEMIGAAGENSLLCAKLQDIGVLYRAFREYLSGHFMTSEEIMDVLAEAVPRSSRLRNSVFLLDGFTGFTPVQNRVIRELLLACRRILVTVTMDAGESMARTGNNYQLFSMSRKMIFSLSGMTGDIEKPVLLFHGEKTRYKDAPELRFLEENLFRYRKKTYTGEKSPRFSGISVFHAASPRQEIAETARRIRMQVREKGLQFGDIAVICGSLEEYAGLCREEFRKAGIPCFIDETHSVLMNPFVEFLRSCLEMVLSDFSEESVFRYLRCGLSDIEREETDALENYVHALGIRGKKKWQEKWLRLYKGMRPEELPPIEDCRARFWTEVGKLAEGFGEKERTVREYAAVLYAFSVSCEAQKKLAQQEKDFHDRQELAMEKEYAQIYGTVMELLDRMVEVLGDERIRGREFLQILETGLSKAKVALIPPGQDQVLVGDMERTRLRDIKALYFVGVNEGNIPKSTQGGGLLNEIDRSFFASQGVELAPDAREQMSIQRFYLYLNLTKPSEYLCLSCPLADLKGEALSPSYLLRSLHGLFPLLQPEKAGESPQGEGEERYAFLPEEASCGLGLFTRGLNERAYREQEPLFSELYSWYLQDASSQGLVKRLVETAFSGKSADLISREAAKALYHEIPAGSATRLERYAACAFAHFAAYGLMLRPRQEYEFKASSLGTVVHKALEEFARELSEDGVQWKDLDDKVREEYVDRSLEKSFSEYELSLLKDNERNAYMYQRMRRLLLRTVWELQLQLQNGSFSPELIEASANGGRIDRVDALYEPGKVFVKVVDYKTGSTTFNLLSVYYGLQLQLVLYLDAVMDLEKKKHPELEVIPAGIFYYPVKDPLVDADKEEVLSDAEKAIREKLKYSGLALADIDILKKMDRTLISLPVTLTDKGASLGKKSSAASEKEFEELLDYVKKKTEALRQEILEGNAQVLPYRMKKEIPCTYCDFKRACGFDRKISGYEYRDLPELSREEIWREMEEENRK